MQRILIDSGQVDILHDVDLTLGWPDSALREHGWPDGAPERNVIRVKD